MHDGRLHLRAPGLGAAGREGSAAAGRGKEGGGGRRAPLKASTYHVAAAVAVVRRTKHCDYIAVVGPVVTLHHKLMGTGDSCQVVGVVKLLRNILAETVSSSSWRNTPAASIIRVRPQQVAHGTFLWHLLNSVELSNLVESVDTG